MLQCLQYGGSELSLLVGEEGQEIVKKTNYLLSQVLWLKKKWSWVLAGWSVA